MSVMQAPRRAAFVILMATGLCAVVVGPRFASADPHFVLGEPKFLEPSSESAVLYVTREQFVRASGLDPERLYLDATPWAMLPQLSYVTTVLNPGTRCLSGVHGVKPMCLDIRPGRTYLLRLREAVDANDLWSANLLL